MDANSSSDINKCVLEVLNDRNPNQNEQYLTQDCFIRIHQRDGISIRYSNKRNLNRCSQNRQSLKRQNLSRDEHNLHSVTNADEIHPCKTPKFHVDNMRRHASEFDTAHTKVVEKRTFGNNHQRSWNRNYNNWGNKSHAWRGQRNNQLDNRDRRTTKYTSSNYYNYASYKTNYGSSNSRTVLYTNDSRRANQNRSLTNDDEQTGCFMKLLDCLCLCMCGLFK